MLDTIVTITDDEDPILSFKTTKFNPEEEITGGKFEVKVELSGVSDEIVTFNLTLGGGNCD